MNRRTVVAWAALSVVVPSAWAQVTLVSQQRGISSDIRWENAMGRGGSDGSAYWRDFGPFSMYSESQHPRPPQEPYVESYRSLSSRLSVNSIQADGIAIATLTVPEDHTQAAARSSSSARVGFEAATPVRYRFVAVASLVIERRAYSLSTIEVRVAGPGKPVFETLIDAESESELEIDQRGFLAPGDYEFYVAATARVQNAADAVNTQDNASFSVELQMGCPSDFNFDGTTGSQDFFGYLTAFFAQDASADYTGDSLIDSQDFFVYLSHFLQGC